LLEHGGGGVAQAAVNVAGAFQVEQRGRVVAGLEHERGRQVQGRGPRAGRGVRLAARVQGERVKAGVGISGHACLQVVKAPPIVGDLWAIFWRAPRVSPASPLRESPMKVSDILRLKGNTLYTVTPDERLVQAVQTMAEKDI